MYKLILIQWLYKRGFIIPFYGRGNDKTSCFFSSYYRVPKSWIVVQNHILE